MSLPQERNKIEVERVEAEQEEQKDDTLNGVVEYKISALESHTWGGIEFHRPECRDIQCNLLLSIIKQEGPIHMDLVGKRLAKSWGLTKVGSRMKGVIDEAVFRLKRRNEISVSGQFLWPIDNEDISIRVPCPTEPDTIRNLEHIPPEEVSAAMAFIVEKSVGITPDALMVDTARLFGFSRTTEKMKIILDEALSQLLQNGDLVNTGESITSVK